MCTDEYQLTRASFFSFLQNSSGQRSSLEMTETKTNVKKYSSTQKIFLYSQNKAANLSWGEYMAKLKGLQTTGSFYFCKNGHLEIKSLLRASDRSVQFSFKFARLVARQRN